MWGDRNLKRYLKQRRNLPVQKMVDQLIQDIYEFYDGKEPIAAYIGLTCDMRRRSKEHETGFCQYGKKESTVTKYIKNNPALQYKIVELETEPLEGEEAKKKELFQKMPLREPIFSGIYRPFWGQYKTVLLLIRFTVLKITCFWLPPLTG